MALTNRQREELEFLGLSNSTDDPYNHLYPYGVTYHMQGFFTDRSHLWFVSRAHQARFRTHLRAKRNGFTQPFTR